MSTAQRKHAFAQCDVAPTARGIACPSCGCATSTVKDKRTRGVSYIWRRRICKGCSCRFTTHETIADERFYTTCTAAEAT